MKNVAIYGRGFGSHFSGVAIQLLELLKERNVNIYINEVFLEFVRSKILYNPKLAGTYTQLLPIDVEFDFLFSIGGDGTFLEASMLTAPKNIPILGINTGKLGFLSYINSVNLLETIDNLFSNNYMIEERMLLEVESNNKFYGKSNYCLNDFCIHKNARLNMLKTKVYVDDEYLNTYWSDGLIISTPTGSTAYSLSCGGPIVSPQSDVILITPIANHNLTVRPLVVSGSSKIRIIFDSTEKQILASLDTRTYCVSGEQELLIKKSKNKINFVCLQKNIYFSTLRNKLMWGNDIRS